MNDENNSMSFREFGVRLLMGLVPVYLACALGTTSRLNKALGPLERRLEKVVQEICTDNTRNGNSGYAAANLSHATPNNTEVDPYLYARIGKIVERRDEFQEDNGGFTLSGWHASCTESYMGITITLDPFPRQINKTALRNLEDM